MAEVITHAAPPVIYTLADAARELGRQHRAAGTAPFGSPEYVCITAGSAGLLAALGVTGPVTADNEPERIALIEAYCNALEGPAPAGPPALALAGICEQARESTCGACWAAPGVPCEDGEQPGYHVARFCRAERRGLITAADLGQVLSQLDVFSGASIVRGGES